MKTIVKTIFYLISISVILLAGAACIVRIYERELIDAALQYFAQRQGMQIKAQNIELGMWSFFPHAIIEAKQAEVAMPPAAASQRPFQLQANTISITLDMLTLWRSGAIDIKNIRLCGGFLVIGASLQAKADSVDAPTISVDKITMEDFLVSIEGNAAHLKHLELELSLRTAGLSVSMTAEGKLTKGNIANLHPALKLPAKARAEILIHGGRTTIHSSRIGIAGETIWAHGYFSAANMSLELSTQNARLEHALPYFDLSQTNFEPTSMRGRIWAQAKIHGRHGKGHALRLEGMAQIKNFECIYQKRMTQLKEATAHFASEDISNLHKYSCTITNASAQVDDFVLQGGASIVNFQVPQIRVQSRIILPAHSAADMFQSGTIHGDVDASMAGAEFELVNLKAKLRLEEASISFENKLFEIDGAFTMSMDDIVATNLRLHCNYADAILKAKAHNYMALRHENSTAEVSVSGSIIAKAINVDSLLCLIGSSKDSRMPKLNINISAKADNMTLFDYQHSRTTFALRYNNGNLIVKDLKTHAFGGEIHGNGWVSLHDNNPIIRGKIAAARVQIAQIPYLYSYFKQGSLLGILGGEGEIAAPVQDVAKMKGTFSITIENPEMIDFEPAMSLSDYVKKEHLRHIKFLTLSNTIAIDGGAIRIPSMQIRSTALNAHLDGIHYFGGDFDYHIALLFTEILRGKAQRLDNPIKDGKLKVFVHARRTNGNYSMDYDSDIGRNVRQKLQQEKDSFAKARHGKNAFAGGHTMPQHTPSIEHEDLPHENSPRTTAAPSSNHPPKPKTTQKTAVDIEWDDE